MPGAARLALLAGVMLLPFVVALVAGADRADEQTLESTHRSSGSSRTHTCGYGEPFIPTDLEPDRT